MDKAAILTAEKDGFQVCIQERLVQAAISLIPPIDPPGLFLGLLQTVYAMGFYDGGACALKQFSPSSNEKK